VLLPPVTRSDLKPSNVLLNRPEAESPTAKLSDFGLSRLVTTLFFTQTPDAGTVRGCAGM
jgi:serine/threonine protein kinase